MKNPLHDPEFLLALDNNHNKIIYAKLIALTKDEQPIESIEGVVQSGSIPIDGKSAVRRSCSLTIISKALNINEIYWGFTTKVKIEIGVENNIDASYEPIIWFNQGIYIITDFKTSAQVNNYTITLSGKDKMCLLNGDIGGHFNAETNLKEQDIIDNEGKKTTQIVPIKNIIREMIHHYGQEPWSNIIINNLDDYGLEMLDNNSTNTYYLWRNIESGVYEHITDQSGINQILNDDNFEAPSIPENCVFLNGLEEDLTNNKATKLNAQNGAQYYVFKIDPLGAAGYRYTDLVYDKDLIAAAGDTITSVLDKIVKMLGSFEYFYNLDGQFVFQKKDTYLSTSWSAETILADAQELSYVAPSTIRNKTSYYFENGNLITAIQNSPNILNVRNDYTIWGKKTGINGSEVPIHVRYAIDKKPTIYKTLNDEIYVAKTVEDVPSGAIQVDWRELIYQMAKDYYMYNHDDDFELRISQKNGLQYINGKTGYEQYYHDIEGFWRLLYDPSKKNLTDTTLGVVYDAEGWNVLINEDPTQLLFWFDFYETDGSAVGKFSIPAIGDRTKVVNDDAVRVIVYPDTPDVVYPSVETNIQQEQEIEQLAISSGYSYLKPKDEFIHAFKLSVRKKSAKETMDNLLYTYSHTNDSISLITIPIYYLQPNTIIHVHDELSHIDGYYEINKLTIPLTYNGTMNISAIKIPQQIY